MSKSCAAGWLALAFFLLGDGARMVYVAYYLYTDINPLLLIFSGSLISLFFSLLKSANTKTIRSPACHETTQKTTLLYALINLSTLINWFSAYFSLKFLPPTTASMVAVSVGPFILSLRTQMQPRTLGMCFTIAAMSIAAAAVFNGAESSTHSPEQTDALIFIGAVLSLACGTSIYINTLISKKLSQLNQPPLKINTFKSLLLLPASAFICFHYGLFAAATTKIIDILIFSIFFVFSTQIALQRAISTLEAAPITIGISLAPTASLLVTLLVLEDKTNNLQILMTLLNSTFLVLFGLHYYRKKQV